MFILMHCGGMPFNGETIEDESLGGSETAAYYIAKELARMGHRVTLFTNTQTEGTWDKVKYMSAGVVNEATPMGDRFHFYAMNTPSDVCMIQRAPSAFTSRFASKVNVCWLHDLALFRTRHTVAPAMWNIDSVFTVSEWHKQQVVEVYGLNPDNVCAVTNGIDRSLFDGPTINWLNSVRYESDKVHAPDEIALLYSSRPERGLEHLVRPVGIMERLRDLSPRFHLYVCAYNNVAPQMVEYYGALNDRIDQLSNCTRLGALTKKELADTMRQCDALVYPTEFSEVSCITAMEAMAAGLPFISSDCAALPETCKGSGSVLLPLLGDEADEDAFVKLLKKSFLDDSSGTFKSAHADLQRAASYKYDWKAVALKFEDEFKRLFKLKTSNKETVLKHLVHVSDYYAAKEYEARHPELVSSAKHTASEELRQCYAFAAENNWKDHYEAYYEYEKERGVDYGPETLDGNTRYEYVASIIASVPSGGLVLDYGCAHGHYTINLAKRFPSVHFIGIDLAESNIDKARKWATAEGLGNVGFYHGCADDAGSLQLLQQDTALIASCQFDVVVAAEVLEHVARPWDLVDVLAKYVKPTGRMVVTTPYGPWEAVGYEQHWPWRAHVHHLERQDLYDLFEHHPQCQVTVVPSGTDSFGDVLGSYVTTFGKPKGPSGRIDYTRKLSTLSPRQTLSVCMIAKDSALTLANCLESVKGIADEIIVAIDETSSDETETIANKYAKGMSPTGVLVTKIKSPLEIGFDEARNLSIANAQGDWILWIDADEVLYHPERLVKYLRHNQFSAYAVKQLHYSVEPPGLLRTDLPSRVFRNNIGVKFFGVVHEHPELTLNGGIGQTTLLDDISIGHYGYPTEDVRRGRFKRNIGLLVRDRQKYPERHLGKFLWFRDLSQMCRWEHEENGGRITMAMRARAREGLALWEELLALGQTRMLTEPESIELYSTLVRVLGEGFDFGFRFDTSKANGGAHPEQAPLFIGRFASRAHAERLFLTLLKERTTHYDSKYF